MRLLRVRLINYQSHSESEIDLSTVRAAAIVGKNGAGKSSIVDAVEWAFFGGSPDDYLKLGQSRGGVEVDLDIDGTKWTINRGRERAKKSWLVIEEEGKALDFHTLADAQVYLEGLLGFTRDQFRATYFFGQGEAGMLAAMSPGQRKALLADLLGMQHYEVWRERASAEARKLETQIAIEDSAASRAEERLEHEVRRVLELQPAYEATLRESEKEVAEAEEALADAEAAVEVAKKVRLREAVVGQMAQIKARGQAAQRALGRRQALLADIGANEGALVEFEEMDRLRRDYEARKAAVGAEVAARRQLLRSREELLADVDRRMESLEERLESLDEEARALRQKIDGMKPSEAECPTCGQSLADEAFERAKEAAEARHKAVSDQVVALVPDGNDLGRQRVALAKEIESLRREVSEPQVDPRGYDEKRWTLLRDASRGVERCRAQVAEINPEDPEALRAEWARLRDEAAALPTQAPLAPDPTEVKQRLRAARGRVESAKVNLESCRLAAEQQAGLEEEIATARKKAAELQARATALQLAARAFSRDGIPAMILDNAVGGIEAAANEALENLGASMRLGLATQRAKKSGKGMSETLEIVVHDGSWERPLASFSGGEKYRAYVALRLGLAALLSAGSGRDCDFLLVDEPTDLDNEGVRMLADLLQRTGKQILLVSHEAELVDAMPQRLKVSRPGQFDSSKVEVG